MSLPVLPVAFIESIGGGELMMVLIIALLLFGGDKMPELARGLGKSLREFKKATGSMQDELRRAMDEVEKEVTIEPPRPASPEIKSTPGILPPGAEGPPAPPADDPSYGSDPYHDFDANAPAALDPAAASAIPAPALPPAETSAAPPASIPTTPPSDPAALAAEAAPPPPKPNADPGAAA